MMGKLRQAGTFIDQAANLSLSAEKSKPDSRTTHTEALVRANLSIYIGDIEACWRDARVFSELADRSGSTWAIAVAASTLGRAHLAGRRWSQSRDSLEYALAQARQHKLGLEAEASYLAFLAEAIAGTVEMKKALAIAEDAVTVACRKETLFWELQAQISLAGILLRRKQIEDQPRIAKALAWAEELIAKTGGEVMRPFVIKRQTEFARLKGAGARHQRLLQETHCLFVSMEATGYAERLAEKLRDFESCS